MANYIKSDLEFILDQIRIAEAHAAGQPLSGPGGLIPAPTLSLGLRTVDGSYNNLIPGNEDFGTADQPFPSLLEPEYREGYAPGADGGVPVAPFLPPNSVVDAQPRIISNLIVDQSTDNPAAVEAAAAREDVGAGLVPDTDVFFIPNVAPDEGLSAPFNSWMTLFGQFFDHGLDLVNKGGTGLVYIPLQHDDPLYDAGEDGIAGTEDDAPTNFMLLTRAMVDPGADGQLGTADDIAPVNATTPLVDQNQTYASHPAMQVFLRQYVLEDGVPVATGRLIEGSNGGMATWADIKAQAETILGIALDDMDALGVPMVATDPYGNFIPGPTGFPQLVGAGDVLTEGSLASPADASQALRTGHAFLLDIAHEAAPVDSQGTPLAADDDSELGLSEPGAYDNELLDRHFISGDGRANENIGLTAVHHIFHSEHNRLVEHSKSVILESGDLAFLNEWLSADVAALPTTQAEIDALRWDGERLFQAARFGTEMQYQHLVFEDFARKIQPQVDIFIAPAGFDVTIDPGIVAEFAHTVYRFGHSMLTETIDRFDASFTADHLGLIEAFLNPVAFDGDGSIDAEIAAGAVVRGMTRQVGNEIDEFVTDALRDNLLGLPLDLPSINIARGRDTGVPSLNSARRDFYEMTGDSQLKPYESWFDFAMNLKNQMSIVNFIAAYGTHQSILDADTLAEKRAAAMLIVFGGDGEALDREDFLHGRGAWASGPDGVTVTGLDAVDLWIGGLAERLMPFGGMLGSTFNFVFETQLEALQNGDRFYYLARTAGLNFLTELENNSFTTLLVNNTDARHLPIDAFSTPNWILEVDRDRQFTGLGADGTADPRQPGLVPLVIRNDPATPGPDGHYLRYTGAEHVVLGGTEVDDVLIAGLGDDTVWGDGGDDRIEGGFGNDNIDGGAGDDIIQDSGGDDVIKGGAGDDVIHGGPGLNLLISGYGSDVVITGEDVSEVFAGPGDDFILGSSTNELMHGNEGDDWIQVGTQDGAPGDNFDPFGRDRIDGHDVFLGNGGPDEAVGEGGDDIMVGSRGPNRYEGMSGFDWVTYKDLGAVYADLLLPAFDEDPNIPLPETALDRYESVEGLSGTHGDDTLLGSDVTAADMPNEGARGSVLTAAGIARIAGLQALLGAGVTSFDGGNIILGGDGDDVIEGRGGDDLIDGDRWLNVRISVRDPADAGIELASFDSLVPLVPRLLSGEISPSQLRIAREIVTADGEGDVDTARYVGLRADYTIEVLADGSVRVTDTVGEEGTDTLKNIERLRFADQVMLLGNDAPIGAPDIVDPVVPGQQPATPTEGQVLAASLGTLVDPDGTTTSIFAFQWQELIDGVWTDISGATGLGFTPGDAQVGRQLRVRVSFVDDGGTAESAVSQRTGVVGDLFASGAGAQTFDGTEGDDIASTGDGNDVLNGNGGDDLLNGGNQNDALNGGAGADELTGGAGADTLDGGVGADIMRGGTGSDTYLVDPLDTVIEAAGAGTDTVLTTLNAFSLPANVERVTFVGAGDFIGTGNGLANLMRGGAGNDTLDGGGGIDQLLGFLGDDTYVIDNTADVVIEAVGAGIDRMLVSVSDTIAANVEDMVLTGAGNIRGTGNGLANSILGNAGSNLIAGGGGNDLLAGGLGADTLQGNAGNDVLIGGGGNDAMNGGAGADVFRIEPGSFGADTVAGFDANPIGGQDLIDLSGLGITAATFGSAVEINGGASTLVHVTGLGPLGEVVELGRITLSGVGPGAISEDDFLLL